MLVLCQVRNCGMPPGAPPSGSAAPLPGAPFLCKPLLSVQSRFGCAAAPQNCAANHVLDSACPSGTGGLAQLQLRISWLWFGWKHGRYAWGVLRGCWTEKLCETFAGSINDSPEALFAKNTHRPRVRAPQPSQFKHPPVFQPGDLPGAMTRRPLAALVLALVAAACTRQAVAGEKGAVPRVLPSYDTASSCAALGQLPIAIATGAVSWKE